MKQSIFPQLLLLISFIIVFCQTYFKEDIFVKNDFHFKWITLLVFLIFNIFQMNLENIKNIFSFKKNYNQYVSLKDSFFIENDYKNLLNKLNNYDINCIQLFSYDSSLPYLLRKKSCTKYNFIYILSSESVQKDLIRELKKKKPEIILANESYPSDILISPHLRFSLVTSYIKDNYIIKEKFKIGLFMKLNKKISLILISFIIFAVVIVTAFDKYEKYKNKSKKILNVETLYYSLILDRIKKLKSSSYGGIDILGDKIIYLDNNSNVYSISEKNQERITFIVSKNILIRRSKTIKTYF